MKSQPNIVFILTDQQRLSAVGAYGETPCRTPHIDRLAREGVLFRNAYTVCPVCSPARATIMTGVYPHSHGISTNLHEVGCSVHELQDRPSLLPRKLQAAGYSTGYTGKWHLGTEAETTFGGSNVPSLPSSMGFEGQDFPGHGGAGESFQQYREWLAKKGYQFGKKSWSEPTRNIRAAELDIPTEASVPAYLVDNTIEMIERFSARPHPFFISLNFWGPHDPYHATEEFVDLYRDLPIPPWPNYNWDSRGVPGPHHLKIHWENEELTWSDWEMAIRYYYARTSMIDSQIGRLHSYLESSGMLSDTVIMFAADHGETLGSHGGLVDKGWNHFEETHRIPLILRFPDGTAAGESRDEFVSTADFYPTLLDLAHASPSDSAIHGSSIVSLAGGETGDGPHWDRESAVTEFLGLGDVGGCLKTIRSGHLKYGCNLSGESVLYDLEKDPHEMMNLIDDPDYAAELLSLQGKLEEWMVSTQDSSLRMYRWLRGMSPD